jgi:hypothetical protein
MTTYIEELEIRLIDLKEEYLNFNLDGDEDKRMEETYLLRDIENLEEEIFQYYENN